MVTVVPMMLEAETRAPAKDDEAGFGALACERGRLPLEAMEVTARISGLVAEISVSQTFMNAWDEAIEATYIFPLPDRAAVTGFRMEVNGRVIEGVLKERGEARRDYDQAIQAGHRAAITEEERPGVFTMRAGNIMPKERARVRLVMTGPLPFSDGEATFQFPLVVAPRYIPGAPLPGDSVGDGVAQDTDAVPDASRITPPVLLPGFPNPVRLSMAVELDPAGLQISDLRSSLHAVVESTSGAARRIELKPGERLNRDFILRYKVAGPAVQGALFTCPDVAAEGREGTFALAVIPPEPRPGAVKPRDVVFVLDRSGSMGGWKMVAARRAVARMVDTLGDKDRFTVLAFDDRIERPPQHASGTLLSATDRNRFRGIEFLAKVDARGGTEMAAPLAEAAGALAGGYDDRDRILVLVTDGQVGNEDQILRDLSGRIKNVRVFTLGVDRAVNQAFLRRLAVLGAGATELVESEDRLDEVMDKIHARISTPVITELSLAPNGFEIVPESTVPARFPALWTGAPLVVMGRYRGSPEGGITVTGKDALGGRWSDAYRASPTSNPAVRSLWARGQVRTLEDQLVTGHGDKAALSKRITETSLRFGVLCRFTAFVAVDRTEKVAATGGRKVMQPVESPDGWDMLELERSAPRGRMAAAPAPAGAPGASVNMTRAGGYSGDMKAMMEKMKDAAPMEASALGGGSHLPPPPSPPVSMPMPSAAPRQQAFSGAPPKPAKSGGVGQLLKNLVRAADDLFEAKKEDAGAADELGAYRARAKKMVEGLGEGGTEERRARMVEVARALAVLIEDLESIGAADGEVRPLRDLLAALRSGIPSADAVGLGALEVRAKKDLEAFADRAGGAAPAAPAPSRRDDFWK